MSGNQQSILPGMIKVKLIQTELSPIKINPYFRLHLKLSRVLNKKNYILEIKLINYSYHDNIPC